MIGTKWTDRLISRRLAPLVGRYGRMPSCREMRDNGQNDLACAISKGRRFAAWAIILGVPMKDSDTKRGWAAEERVTAELHAVGLNPIRQRTRAPFDIQVGPVRVNVKSASFRTYGEKRVGAWFMGMAQSALHCDMFALVRYDRPDLPTLWIHSKDANQGTLSLTLNHRFNYMSLSIAPGSLLWVDMSQPPPLPPTPPPPPLHKTYVAILRAVVQAGTDVGGFIPHGAHEWRAIHRLQRKGLVQNAGLMHCGWDDCPKPAPHESKTFTITPAGLVALENP